MTTLFLHFMEDFAYFTETCFKSFGDQVKYWVTINEPNILSNFGYRTWEFPPSRCSRPIGNCIDGDSEKEPFIAAHNFILSHATAVNIYRTKYQHSQDNSNMGIHKALFLSKTVLLISALLSLCSLISLSQSLGSNVSPLPPGFLFGTASSAYQIEGAYLADGKGLSNWDVFTHIPGKIRDGSNGDIALDHYHLYLEDINLMSSLGVNSYRFSISWTRILPKGRFGNVNLAGVDFYNKLIDALLLKGIQPFVTLSHMDSPQELEERYGSWLNPKSQEDFAYFAETCFKSFGDRVKYWVTINEPNILSNFGYRTGEFPPSRCSRPFGNCIDGDSEKEPFIAVHNCILSHATAVNIYRTKYQKQQGGSIGIVVQTRWFEPVSNSTADKLATERAQSFFTNWVLDPIIHGKYPAEMEQILGNILPKFSASDKEKLRVSGSDFIGINHYTSYYVQDCILSPCEPGIGVTWTEGSYQQSSVRNGVPIGESMPGTVDWLNVYPQGMEKIITYLKERYNNTPMFITENGYGSIENPNSTFEEALNDVNRVKFMSGHLNVLLRAVRNGADVRGYFAWSLLDNFEWLDGYTVRFGLHYVDATLKRTKKLSATWYKQFITKHRGKILFPQYKRGYSQY